MDEDKDSIILSQVVSALKERWGVEAGEFRGDVTVVVPAEMITEILQTLRDEFSFELLVEETAVDYWPEQTPRFHMIYQVRSLKHNLLLGLRVPLNGNAPTIQTITGIYLNANWFERELWDLFGIRYIGHPDLRRILMPADWEGHPLRKDYPLGYEEVQFSFNALDIDQHKPYAKE